MVFATSLSIEEQTIANIYIDDYVFDLCLIAVCGDEVVRNLWFCPVYFSIRAAVA
jgi:hypothetical protein